MDFGSSIYKAKPGLKSYLFVSPYLNVLDELLNRTLQCDYINRLSHPFVQSDFDMVLGVSEDKQAIVINSNGLSTHEQDIIVNFLSLPKVKNLSLYLVGQDSLSNDLRSRITKQGLFVNAVDPNTALSQKHVSEWFGDECKIHVSDAYVVAQSLNWNLGGILWAIKSYQAVTQGKVVDRPTSQKIMKFVCFDDRVASMFRFIINKKRNNALSLSHTFDSDMRSALLDRLRDFLSGISLVAEAVKKESSVKKIAAEADRSVLDVELYQPLLHKYTYSNIIKCNKILDFAQEHLEEPEIIETVVMLWAS